MDCKDRLAKIIFGFANLGSNLLINAWRASYDPQSLLFFYLVKNRLGKRNLVEVIGLKANMLRRIPSTENWIVLVLSALVVVVLWKLEWSRVPGTAT